MSKGKENTKKSIDQSSVTNSNKKKSDSEKENDLPGYTYYPPEDDIYKKEKELKDVDPEDPSRKKAPNEKPGTRNEKNFGDILTGSDLDVPGSELDDQLEDIGSEDEENNYYSLGGDAHSNLDEDHIE